MDLLLVTGNRHKAAEFSALLAAEGMTDIRLLSLNDVGLDGEVDENGETFEENALIKARYGAAHGYVSIADDSGLEVDALGGAPGVHSARYAGVHGDDAANNRLLLQNMIRIPEEKRTAGFVCAIACVWPDGRNFTVRGEARGRVLFHEEGTGGFGYDPLFLSDDHGKTYASLTPEEKNSVSHRQRAVKLFVQTFRKIQGEDHADR